MPGSFGCLVCFIRRILPREVDYTDKKAGAITRNRSIKTHGKTKYSTVLGYVNEFFS